MRYIIRRTVDETAGGLAAMKRSMKRPYSRFRPPIAQLPDRSSPIAKQFNLEKMKSPRLRGRSITDM